MSIVAGLFLLLLGLRRGAAAAALGNLLYTLAAQLTSLPVILYHIQRLSLTSLLANPLVLPSQPAVMALGGLSVLLGLVWPHSWPGRSLPGLSVPSSFSGASLTVLWL